MQYGTINAQEAHTRPNWFFTLTNNPIPRSTPSPRSLIRHQVSQTWHRCQQLGVDAAAPNRFGAKGLAWHVMEHNNLTHNTHSQATQHVTLSMHKMSKSQQHLTFNLVQNHNNPNQSYHWGNIICNKGSQSHTPQHPQSTLNGNEGSHIQTYHKQLRCSNDDLQWTGQG